MLQRGSIWRPPPQLLAAAKAPLPPARFQLPEAIFIKFGFIGHRLDVNLTQCCNFGSLGTALNCRRREWKPHAAIPINCAAGPMQQEEEEEEEGGGGGEEIEPEFLSK